MKMRGGLGEMERQTVDGMSDEQPRGGGVPPAHSFGQEALPGIMTVADWGYTKYL